MSNVLNLSLCDVGKGIASDGRKLVLPPVQRGLVWNAVRVEVLWDSILRGLPIGTFSVKAGDGSWDLMDGQQRSNAISMAFAFDSLRYLTPQKLGEARSAIEQGDFGSNTIALKPILWIDVGADTGNCGVQTLRVDSPDAPNRIFKLKVTTAAHPWGYGDSGKETVNDVFNVAEQRRIVAEEFACCGAWRLGERPLPYEVWPVKSILPVPMSAVVSFVLDTNAADKYWMGFVEWCKHYEGIRSANWYRHKLSSNGQSEVEDNWRRIVACISERLQTTRVPVNVVSVASEDVGLYFSRMNKAGIVPTVEEIQYSLLKDSLKTVIPGREVWDRLEVYASSLGIKASRLMGIVVRFLLNLDSDQLSGVGNELKISEVMSVRELLSEFLAGAGLALPDGRHLTLFEMLDGIDSEFCGSDIALKWILSEIASEDDGVVFLFAMRMAYFGEIAMPGNLTKCGLLTCLAWFSRGDATATIQEMWRAGGDVASGLYRALRRDNCGLVMPLDEDDWNRLGTAFENSDGSSGLDFVGKFRSALLDDRIKDRLACICCGFADRAAAGDFQHAHGKSLLLFACRKYIQGMFKGCVPGQAQWMEQNKPWDIDHVLPKSYLPEDISGQQEMTYATLVWSIGNAAPIPFQVNRSKNAGACGPYYPYRQGEVPESVRNDDGTCNVADVGLHLTQQLTSITESPKTEGNYFDAVPSRFETIFNYCRATFGRMKELYLDWYRTCGIDSIREVVKSAAAQADRRNEILRSMLDICEEKEIPAKLYYVAGSHEFEVESDLDMARPWVTLGVQAERSMVALTANEYDGRTWQVGLRKDPKEAKVDREWGEKIYEKEGASTVRFGGAFINTDWWYYYLSPRKKKYFDLKSTIDNVGSLFNNVLSVAKKLELIYSDNEVEEDCLQGDAKPEGDEPHEMLDTSIDII